MSQRSLPLVLHVVPSRGARYVGTRVSGIHGALERPLSERQAPHPYAMRADAPRCAVAFWRVFADASIINFWHRAPAGALAAVCWGRRYIRIVRRSETIIHRSIGNRSTHHHPSEWAQTRSNEMHVKGQLVRCRKDPPPNEFLGDAATRSRSGQLAEGRGCSSVRRLDRSTLPRIKQLGPHCGHIKPLDASCTGCVARPL